MPLINSSYFDGERIIPDASYADVTKVLNGIIARREPEYLKTVLGYELFILFMAGIQVTTPDQRYTDLLVGKDFTGQNGKLKRWAGFINVTPNTTIVVANAVSPIADYVYYYWLKQNHTQTSGLGEVANVAQNAVRVSPKLKAVDAWDSMVDRSWLLYEFLKVNPVTYPEFQAYLSDPDINLMLTRINTLF